MKMFKNSPYYKKILALINKNIKIKWFNVIKGTIKSYIFIRKWAQRHQVHFRLKYALRLSAHTALVLQDMCTDKNIATFFSGIALVRYWDDFYDRRVYPIEVLREIREAVIADGKSDHELVKTLRGIFFEAVQGYKNNTDKIKARVYEIFYQELNRLLDGFEYEYLLKKEEINLGTEAEYLHFANRTIGLPYIIRIMGMLFVETEQDLAAYLQIINYENFAAEPIRLANDIAGHSREAQIEDKVDIITIRKVANSESYDEAIEHVFAIMYSDLDKLNNQVKSTDKYAYVLKSVGNFAVKQYLVASFLYKS